MNSTSIKIREALSLNDSSLDFELEPNLHLKISRHQDRADLWLRWRILKPLSQLMARSWSMSQDHLTGLNVETFASLQDRQINWRTTLRTNRSEIIEQAVYGLMKIKDDFEDPRIHTGLSKKQAEEQIAEIHREIVSLAQFGRDGKAESLSSDYEEIKRCIYWTGVNTETLNEICAKISLGDLGKLAVKKFIGLVQAENEIIDLVRSPNEKRDLQREWNRTRVIHEDSIRNAWEIIEGHWRFLEKNDDYCRCKESLLRCIQALNVNEISGCDSHASDGKYKIATQIILNSGGDEDLLSAAKIIRSSSHISHDKIQQIGSCAIAIHQSYCRMLSSSNKDVLADHQKRVIESLDSKSATEKELLSKGIFNYVKNSQEQNLTLPISIARTLFPAINGKLFNPLVFLKESPCGQALIFDDCTDIRNSNSSPTTETEEPTIEDDDSIEAQLDRAAMALLEEEEKRSLLHDLSDLGYSLDVHEKSAPPGMDALAIFNELKKTVVGQDDACKAMAAALRSNSTGFGKGAVLILGKTGTGKSHLVSQAAKAMKGIKVAHVSAPALVPEGIRGQTISDVLLSLIDEGKKENHIIGKGIVVFDEIDKLVIGGGFETYYRSAINNILRVIDGGVWNFGTHEEKPKAKTMDTSQLLIVLAGAWQEESTVDLHSVGFSVGDEMKPKRSINTNNLGFPQELLGRISRTIRLNDHTVESLIGILESESVSPWIRAEGILGQEIMVSRGANEKIAKKAVELGLGARFLDTTVTGVIDRLMFENLKGAVVIDEVTIKEYL